MRLMEANPNAGIIQFFAKSVRHGHALRALLAVCHPVFTGRCLLPVCTSGSWVSPTTGVTTPLSVKPFILSTVRRHRGWAKVRLPADSRSHDFVEAALMRRRVGGVWIAYLDPPIL